MTQQINLYDPALRPRRELLTATYLAVAAGVLALVLGVWGTWLRIELGQAEAAANISSQDLKRLQDETAAVGREIANRKPDPRLELELAGVRQLLGVRNEVLALLGKGLGPDARGFSEYLVGLSRQASTSLWLTGFAVSDNGANMAIQGRTLDPASLPDYIRRLNGEKAFQGHAFSALRMSAVLPPAAAGREAPAAPAAAPPRAAATLLYHEFVLVPAKSGTAADALAPGQGGRS